MSLQSAVAAAIEDDRGGGRGHARHGRGGGGSIHWRGLLVQRITAARTAKIRMKPFFMVLCGCAILLTFSGLLVAQEPLAVTCFGDSHTVNGVYPSVLATRLQQEDLLAGTLQTRAVGGWTVADHLARIAVDPGWISPTPGVPNLAIMLIGTNGYDPAGLAEFLTLTMAAGYNNLIITTPPRRGPNPLTGAGGPGSNLFYNDSLRATYMPLLSGLPANHLIDPVPLLLDPAIPISFGEWLNPDYNVDDVHLNEAGYQILGNEVARNVIGSLRGWDDLRLVRNNQIFAVAGSSTSIANGDLRITSLTQPASVIMLTVVSDAGGGLYLDGIPLGIGSSFSQADIDQGRLSYLASDTIGQRAVVVDVSAGTFSLMGITMLVNVSPAPAAAPVASVAALPNFWTRGCGNGGAAAGIILLFCACLSGWGCGTGRPPAFR